MVEYWLNQFGRNLRSRRGGRKRVVEWVVMTSAIFLRRHEVVGGDLLVLAARFGRNVIIVLGLLRNYVLCLMTR